MKPDAVPTEEGRWRYQDLDCVVEVIHRGTEWLEFGPKRDAYAVAGVPVHLIVDPYGRGACHLFTEPRNDGSYRSHPIVHFGSPIDLTGTVVGLVLETDGFLRD